MRARPRCSSTRWLPGSRPRIAQTSAASRPWTSRRCTTARWPGGRARMEPARIDRRAGLRLRPGLIGGKGTAERDAAAFPRAPSAGDVEQDAEHPGPQAGSALEPVQPGEHGQPRLLHDLLGHGPAGYPISSANACSSPQRPHQIGLIGRGGRRRPGIPRLPSLHTDTIGSFRESGAPRSRCEARSLGTAEIGLSDHGSWDGSEPGSDRAAPRTGDGRVVPATRQQIGEDDRARP